MIGVVLVTHGRLAVEFRAALEHVVGPQVQIEAVTIGPDDDVEERRKDIIEAVKRVDSGDGVAILTDMFGGTPSNLAISVTKWTGADLPGSVSSTYKYRLIVVAKGGQAVTLTAQNLAPGWVASFCADRLCSPGKVTFTPPESGVKTYEFQLVPPNPGAKPNDNIAVVSNGVTATVPAR